jgi:hypothetical protein
MRIEVEFRSRFENAAVKVRGTKYKRPRRIGQATWSAILLWREEPRKVFRPP